MEVGVNELRSEYVSIRVPQAEGRGAGGGEGLHYLDLKANTPRCLRL